MIVVLVVEDEVLVRTFLQEALSEVGYEVLEAASGHEALELVRARADVAAMITDVELLGFMDGFELARTVKDERPEMIVLIASGRTWPRPGQMPEGAVWVQKPYTAEFLVHLLADRLGSAKDDVFDAGVSAAILTDNPVTQGLLAEPVMEEPKKG